MKKIFAIAVLCLLSSCASILSGTSTTINVVPSDATQSENIKVEMVSKSGVQNLTLPTVVTVKKANEPIKITVRDKCYKETIYTAQSTVNLWFLGNFITGGTFGTTTDALTGALWTYDDVIVVPVVQNGTCK